MKHFFLKIILALSVASTLANELGATQAHHRVFGAPRQVMVAERLPLHKLLVEIQTNIASHIKEFSGEHAQSYEPDYKTAFRAASDLARESLALMAEITNDFNTGNLAYNPEIEYRFFNMCNVLSYVETSASFEPYHLREQIEHVKRYNDYVTRYCISRKNFLTIDDLALFNKITRFNQIIMLCLLRDDYLNLSILDSIIDKTIYRPWEFVCRNKLAFGLLAAGIALGYGYYWYNHVDLSNKNPSIEVQQDYMLKQVGLQCGFKSVYSTWCLAQSNNNHDAFLKMANDAQGYQNFYTQWFGAYSRGELRDHLGVQINPELYKDSTIVREAINDRVVKSILREVFRENNDALSHISVIPDGAILQEGRQQFWATQNNGDETPLQAAIDRFRDQNNQQATATFIVNTANTGYHKEGDEAKLAEKTSHWITYHIIKDLQAKGGVRVIALDSLNSNITNFDTLNLLHAHLVPKKP